MKRILSIVVTIFVIGCAPAPIPVSRPEAKTPPEQAMTATEHRQEAAAEDVKAEAQGELGQQTTSPEGRGPAVTSRASQVYTLEKSADAHRAAAAKIENQAIVACNSSYASDRSYCPLTNTKVSKTSSPMKNGVRIALNSTSLGGLRELDAQIKCHISNSQVGGAQNDSACPLSLKGVRASVSGTDAQTVVSLESDEPRDALLLQMWAKSICSPK